MFNILEQYKPSTPEEQQSFLLKLVNVGEELNKVPAVKEFLELQINMHLNTLTSHVSGTPEFLKEQLIRVNAEIGVYKYLLEAAANVGQNMALYNAVAQSQNNEV